MILEENQRHINDLAFEESAQGHRNLIHSQINSLLIHVNEHLDYVGYLLSSKENNEAYSLALDDYEREHIVQSLTNKSQQWKSRRDTCFLGCHRDECV